jgi:hypothetical protein
MHSLQQELAAAERQIAMTKEGVRHFFRGIDKTDRDLKVFQQRKRRAQILLGLVCQWKAPNCAPAVYG